jgi:hypothetical protein
MESAVPNTSEPDALDSWTTPRARLAGYKRQQRPDTDPKVIDARLELRAARLADYIRRTVDEAPPLADATRNRLALLLRGGGDHGGTAA